ncbi:alpha/beta fold hydrolase [Paraburkholderia xenovorans]|uniref:esterase/lipase family protein n=1 Tax=Paraburkholderia xenovorans TaxID=36873 RepID=UPI0038BC5ACA
MNPLQLKKISVPIVLSGGLLWSTAAFSQGLLTDVVDTLGSTLAAGFNMVAAPFEAIGKKIFETALPVLKTPVAGAVKMLTDTAQVLPPVRTFADNNPVKDANTRYPVIFVHSLTGSEKFVGELPYWFDMAREIRMHRTSTPGDKSSTTASSIPNPYFSNNTENKGIYEANVSGFNTDEERGEQLLAQIKEVMIREGATRVNLIGHSQGGTTSRYVAAIRPDLVASITTISTPHWGSDFADFIVQQKTDYPKTAAQVMPLVDYGIGMLWMKLVGAKELPQDPAAAISLLTSAKAKEWNKRYPSAGLGDVKLCTTGKASADVDYVDARGVKQVAMQRYYSIIGESNKPPRTDNVFGLMKSGLGALSNQVFKGVPILNNFDFALEDTSLGVLDAKAFLDPTTVALELTGSIVAQRVMAARKADIGSGGGAPDPKFAINDGMVSVCSAKFGKVVAQAPWNHFDEVNQMAGIVGMNAPDPRVMILDQVRQLAKDNL